MRCARPAAAGDGRRWPRRRGDVHGDLSLQPRTAADQVSAGWLAGPDAQVLELRFRRGEIPPLSPGLQPQKTLDKQRGRGRGAGGEGDSSDSVCRIPPSPPAPLPPPVAFLQLPCFSWRGERGGIRRDPKKRNFKTRKRRLKPSVVCTRPRLTRNSRVIYTPRGLN